MRFRENNILLLLFLLSFIGLLDTLYLTVSHYKQMIPPCSVARGCETVLTSQFATIAGLPVALLGLFFYIFFFVLLIMYKQTKHQVYLLILFLMTTLGALGAAGFIFVQGFILHAFCQYCMVSDSITILLFLLILVVLLQKKTMFAEKR